MCGCKGKCGCNITSTTKGEKGDYAFSANVDLITPPSGTLTVAGNLTVNQQIIASGGVVIPAGNILRTDAINSRSGSGLFFTDSVGFTKSAFTQLTSISTTVATANIQSGVITTVSSTIAAGASASFTVTNTNILATSIVTLTCDGKATTGIPYALVQDIAAGSFVIVLRNIHSATAFNGVINIHYFISY